MIEDRLPRLLKELTPQPPRALVLADLAPGSTPGRARVWLAPIAAAALVTAVVIAATVWAVRAHTSAGPQPLTHQPAPPGSATWDAQPLADQQADAILGTSASLYSVLNENSETTITRIDPTSGATLDRTSYRDSDVATFSLRPPVLSGGSLWVSSDPDSHGVVQLRAFDPTTLLSRRVIKLSFAGAVNAQTSFAAGPSGSIYVGAGHSLVIIDTATIDTATDDTATDEVTRRIDVGAGYVAGIAVAPDDSRLYLGVMPDVTGALLVRTDLQSRDPRTHSIIREVGGTATFGPGLGGIQAMMASAGGVWIANAVGGNGEQVLFVPADLDLAQTRVPAAAQGGGGMVAFATLANNTVWIGGGPGGLACADPVSGRSRSSTVLPNGTSLFDVTYAGGRAFAIEDADGSRRIVSINPPSVCTP
jgi:hypothetical protein